MILKICGLLSSNTKPNKRKTNQTVLRPNNSASNQKCSYQGTLHITPQMKPASARDTFRESFQHLSRGWLRGPVTVTDKCKVSHHKTKVIPYP